MDYLCPDIERLVACYSCGTQTLPPYRLCMEAHVVCPTCFKYLPRCACYMSFSSGPHSALDWVVQAMKLRCRYAMMARNNRVSESAESISSGNAGGEGGRRVEIRTEGGNRGSILPPSDDVDDCHNRWYSIPELCEHYRSGCRKNIFACPLPGCRHVGHTDTIVEHYEDTHGPFEEMVPEYPLKLNSITFTVDLSAQRSDPVIRKIFNGYFLFIPKMIRRGSSRNFVEQVSLKNINPIDYLQYVYNTTMVAKEVTVKIWLNDVPND